MEKKRWMFIFSALCLALAFSVSSVEARLDKCEPCGSCDQDGDGLTRPSRGCINSCGGEIDVDDSGTAMCEEGDPDTFNLYQVTLSAPVSSSSATWEDKTSGEGWIGTPVHNPGEMAVDLSFFQGKFVAGSECFPNDDEGMVTILNGAQLQVKNVKGMDEPQAFLTLWLQGGTKEEDDEIDVGYQIDLFGTFQFPLTWPDTQNLTLTEWETSVNTSKKGGRKIACTSEGFFIDPILGGQNVTMEVIQTQ